MDLPVIKLTRGVPPPESFPSDELAACACTALSKDSGVVLQYGAAGGYPSLRTWLAQQAGVSENRVIIAQGSLQLQDTVSRILIQPDDLVYTEKPTYDRTLTVFRRAGARVLGFTVHQDGPDVDEIEAHLKAGECPKLFYIIPDFQNPTGAVISFEKRKRITELAEKYNFYIIEDVPYRKLRYRGQEIPSFFDIAQERVMQMSSYSKLIAPGLRVGYVIAPDGLASRISKFSEDIYINPSYFTQAIVFEYIQRGWLERNINKLKALYTPRLDAMLAGLENQFGDLATWWKPDGGFFVGMTLNFNVNADELLAKASQVNLQLTDGRGFFSDRQGDRFVRLPFCALTPYEIEEGLARLGNIIRELSLVRSN